jgi:uncharacterized protein
MSDIAQHSLQVMLFARFAQRARGLLGREALLDSIAVKLMPCRSIHTFGMRRRIDVIFMDRQDRVLSLHSNLQPYRFCVASHRQAYATLELAAGTVRRLKISVNDQMIFKVTEEVA